MFEPLKEPVIVEPAETPPVDHRAATSLFSRLRTARGQADPFPIYAEMRSMGGITPAPWGGYVVTSFDLCDQVLRDRDWQEPDHRWRARQGGSTRWDAPSSQEMSRTLPALNGPDHTRVRRAVGNMFDRKSLHDLRHSVASITKGLLDRFEERLHDGEADFHALFSEELPVAAIGRWLEVPTADHAYLRELTHDQVFTQELLPSASQLARSNAATSQLRSYFMELVRQRRKSLGGDPVSAWIRTWDGMESDQDAADEGVYFLTLFVLLAALETTSTLLSTTTKLLLKYPMQWQWLRAHPDHVPAAVEEVLRYDAPTHVISRVAGRDLTLAGLRIPADRMVHLMVGAANRDPAKHLDAELFNLHRKSAHLSFSGGMHYCLGAPLARMEAQTMVQGMLSRFPALCLVKEPVYAPRVAFRRILNLPLASGMRDS